MKNKNSYDFSGWATKNNILCSDGRTILKDAFKQNDGQKVPLVWNHQHNDPSEVLGHALLENRNEGVYAYCKFNNTEAGQTARSLVNNGDIDKLSIYANKLNTQQNNVTHGCIREVSLVLAGANPGAFIDTIISHSDDADNSEEEGVIYTDEHIEVIEHSDTKDEEKKEAKTAETAEKEGEKMDTPTEKTEVKKEDNRTIGDIFDTLTDEQKDVVYAMLGQVIQENSDNVEDEEDDEGEEKMKHNVFENQTNNEVLAHSEILADALADAKRYGSLRDSLIEHAAINNITDINKLFPDATALNKEPIMIERDRTWVDKIMNDVKHSPFSRVKTTYGKMTEDQARAKGYIKGNQKTNIALAALNRITTPTTVYIKNEIDRDDVLDITDFDVVEWQKREMRKQLDKELATAMLLGDGRDISSNDKINEQNIIPVLKDSDMYTIQYEVKEGKDYKVSGSSTSANDSFFKGIIRAALKARKTYQGSGSPSMYTTDNYLTEMLLIEDQNGRRIYNSVADLALALRVKEIVTIPEMEKEAYKDTVAVIVNMNDYTAGADKGGSINTFDDFDIDYNQMKYLMETRMSGALTKPYSAIALKKPATVVVGG
jgi:caudovirus prohead protease|nr:MAG TPA: major capsid protein [Caudoviricetes sp.]